MRDAKLIAIDLVAPLCLCGGDHDATVKSVAKALRAERAETAKLRKALEDLTTGVRQAVKAIDAEMARPSTPERGKNIAGITNALEMANDRVRLFALGEKLKR